MGECCVVELEVFAGKGLIKPVADLAEVAPGGRRGASAGRLRLAAVADDRGRANESPNCAGRLSPRAIVLRRRRHRAGGSCGRSRGRRCWPWRRLERRRRSRCRRSRRGRSRRDGSDRPPRPLEAADSEREHERRRMTRHSGEDDLLDSRAPTQGRRYRHRLPQVGIRPRAHPFLRAEAAEQCGGELEGFVGEDLVGEELEALALFCAGDGLNWVVSPLVTLVVSGDRLAADVLRGEHCAVAPLAE